VPLQMKWPSSDLPLTFLFRFSPQVKKLGALYNRDDRAGDHEDDAEDGEEECATPLHVVEALPGTEFDEEGAGEDEADGGRCGRPDDISLNFIFLYWFLYYYY